MTSYLSNILTTTTSRYNSIRRNLLNDETDGDTEDDSHISRVLRAYYTEKGRPFPPWLPPDPKAPQTAPVQLVTSGRAGAASAPPGPGGPAQPPYPTSSRGLGDLWGDSPAQMPAPQSQSLRARRPVPGSAGRRSPGVQEFEQAQARPLPSQRAGSYQVAGGPPRGGGGRMETVSPTPSGGSTGSGGGTAQERLKARLWGGGRTSPSPSPNAGYAPPPPQQQGGGMPYPDAGGRSARMPYPSDGGGDYGGRAPGGRKPVGLPNGPRQGRF
jgi:hypothetical protein